MKNKFSVFAIFFIPYFVHDVQVFLQAKYWRRKVVSEAAQCSETEFWIQEFFFVQFLVFWDMVDFVFNSELATYELFANLIQTLTHEVGDSF